MYLPFSLIFPCFILVCFVLRASLSEEIALTLVDLSVLTTFGNLMLPWSHWIWIFPSLMFPCSLLYCISGKGQLGMPWSQSSNPISTRPFRFQNVIIIVSLLDTWSETSLGTLTVKCCMRPNSFIQFPGLWHNSDEFLKMLFLSLSHQKKKKNSQGYFTKVQCMMQWGLPLSYSMSPPNHIVFSALFNPISLEEINHISSSSSTLSA